MSQFCKVLIALLSPESRSLPWRIAWLNMIGSIMFLIGAALMFPSLETGARAGAARHAPGRPIDRLPRMVASQTALTSRPC